LVNLAVSQLAFTASGGYHHAAMATRIGNRRFDIQIHRACRAVPLPVARLRKVVTAVLVDEDVAAAELVIAIVDDAEIHRVNREHLAHDYPTDVISFLYSADQDLAEQGAADQPGRPSTARRRGANLCIEGELVVSAETAAREAPRHKQSPASELELYVIHGLLHLAGYDDLTPAEKRIMRRREREITALVNPI